MTIYSYIYIFLALLIVAVIIKNRIDLLSIGAACYIMYTIYCISGKGIAGFYRPTLSPKLYYYVYTQQIMIYIFLLFKQRKNKRQLKVYQRLPELEPAKTDKKRMDRSFFIYTLIILGFALINIASIGISAFSSGKANVWKNTNVFYIVSLYGAFVSFAYGLHNKKMSIWLPALFVELTIFFAGARAYTACLILIYLSEKGMALWKKGKKNILLLVVGSLAVLFMLLYRMVDKQIMSGNLSGAMQELGKAEVWLEALEFNEPRVIIANYDYVLTNDVRLPIGDVIYRIIDFIPGLSTLIPIELEFPEYFSTWLRTTLQASAGVGGTIWGESYAMFGPIGIPLATLLWLLFINACNKNLRYSGGHSYFLLSLGTYLSWYISRLDFNRVGQACKIMLLCFAIWAAIYLFQGGVLHTAKYKIGILRRK